jgi:hypothetical protein
MHFGNKLAGLCIVLASILFGVGAQAQSIEFTVRNIALKNGESTELIDVWYINTNCKSVLKSTPEVEIIDGPAWGHCRYQCREGRAPRLQLQ